MARQRWKYSFILVALLATTMLLPVGAQAEKVLYVGGTQSLTGPFAEDSAAVLAAIEDYVAYVNETKKMAPWREEKVAGGHHPEGHVAGRRAEAAQGPVHL